MTVLKKEKQIPSYLWPAALYTLQSAEYPFLISTTMQRQPALNRVITNQKIHFGRICRVFIFVHSEFLHNEWELLLVEDRLWSLS